MAEHSLIVPFLTDDPMYAYGVELGMLYVRMRDGEEDVIEEFFLSWNEDQILLTAGRLGWRGEKVGGGVPGWCRLRLTRGGAT